MWMESLLLPSDLIYGGVLEIKSDQPICDVKKTNIKKVQFATSENFMWFSTAAQEAGAAWS